MKKRGERFVRKTKVERQREIIEATVQLLAKYGVQGTTVSRISAAVGLSRGALYQHFSNREAVLEAALAAMGERSSQWMARSSGQDVLARLLDMGEAHSTWSSTEYDTFVRPFFQLIASNRETGLTRSIIQRQQQDFHYLVDLVDQGKRQGSLSSEVDSGDIAWSILLHAWGEDMARLMGVDQFITEGASNRILRRLLTAYSVAPAPSAAAPAAGPPALPAQPARPGKGRGSKAGGHRPASRGPAAPRRSLVVYSSYTGNTGKVAERMRATFEKNGWVCDCVKIRKRAEDILHPPFEIGDYDFICVGSGIRSHLPYNETLNLLRRLRLGEDPRFALRMRDETIPYITDPLPEKPPPWKDPELVHRHRKIEIGPDSPKAVVFATYGGYEFGPKEAEPSLQLLELEVEHLGFECVGRFCCPGKYLDDPTPDTFHGDIRGRPDERDLRDAQAFIEEKLAALVSDLA